MSQAPTQRASRPSQDPPQDLPNLGWLDLPNQDWFEEIRAAREREVVRRRILANLQDFARQLGVQAVFPDATDPLESIDPTPESDLDFPMSLEDWYATWRIDLEQFLGWDLYDYHYVSD
jgi:hypothetical protein